MSNKKYGLSVNTLGNIWAVFFSSEENELCLRNYLQTALGVMNKEEPSFQGCPSVVHVCFLLPSVAVLYAFFEIFLHSYEVLFSSSTILLTPLLQIQLPIGSGTTFVALVFQHTPVGSSSPWTCMMSIEKHGSQFRVYRRSLIHENAGACSAFPLSCPCHHTFNIFSLAKDVVEVEILLQSSLGPWE